MRCESDLETKVGVQNLVSCVFFFQAEDGIRDLIVTGVQTCALPISWTGALFGLLWGGLARIFLVHHVTWSINSVCHLWGRRPYRSDDESRNNVVFGILGLGEGWHHSHHTFPTSARHGLRWWQIDVSYWVIRVLSW